MKGADTCSAAVEGIPFDLGASQTNLMLVYPPGGEAFAKAGVGGEEETGLELARRCNHR